MFTVSGVGIIPGDEQVVERQNKFGSYFNFTLKTKDSYKKDQKHFLSLSVQVPSEHVAEAREVFVPKKVIWIRIGELSGRKLDTGFVAMHINTKWNWVETLKVPKKDTGDNNG